MDDSLSFTINLISYIAGAWVAFKIFDYKKKGEQRSPKDGRLLWPLLLVFGLGGGSLMAFVLKSWLGVQ